MARHTKKTHAAHRSLTVLVVDDEPCSREALSRAVESLGYRCVQARDGLQARKVQQRRRIDIILSDWRMPKEDGIELCRQVRLRGPSRPYVHFIFVTGNDDRAHFLEGMRAGADDYLTKPVDLEELRARLDAAARITTANRLLEASAAGWRRSSERNFQAARTDPLTRVPNRLELREDLQALEGRARRYEHHYCAALCDVDDFKAYNDHFGHPAGDAVLRRVASAIRAQLRAGDGLYRYGGEEFLVILPEQSIAEASIGMKRVVRSIERLAIAHSPAARTRVVTISAGVAQLRAGEAGGIEDWLRRADVALYRAKARGRNRVEADDPHSSVSAPATG
jgi:two-component system, cell cycle response regulator